MAGPAAFNCGMCNRSFPKRMALQQHVLHHLEMRKSWKCGKCDAEFEDELALETHKITTNHGPMTTHKCFGCGSFFPSANLLTQHRKFPSPCADAFRKKSPPKRQHGAQHLRPPPPPPKLPGKYNEFSSLQYKQPKQEAPSLPSSMFKCAFCNEFMHARDALLHHKHTGHIPQKVAKTYACGDCGATFDSLHAHNGHITSGCSGQQFHLASSNEDIYCHVCEKSFPSKARYDRHFLGCRPPVVQALVRAVQNPAAVIQGTIAAFEGYMPAPQTPTLALEKPRATGKEPEALLQDATLSPKQSVTIHKDATDANRSDRQGIIERMEQMNLGASKPPVPFSQEISSQTEKVPSEKSAAVPAQTVQADHRSLATQNPDVSTNAEQPALQVPQRHDKGKVVALEFMPIQNEPQQHQTLQDRGMPTVKNPIPPHAPQPKQPKSPVEASKSVVAAQSQAAMKKASEIANTVASTSQLPAPDATAQKLQPTTEFRCSSCPLTFRSEPALNVHRQDAHGIGGKGLDLHGKDQWMLSQRERERLRNQGLLRGRPPVGPAASKPYHGPPKPSNTNGGPVSGPRNAPQVPPPPPPSAAPMPVAAGSTVDLAAEMGQAREICGMMLRVQLQADVFIHPNGTFTYSGNCFVRIGVAKQSDVKGMVSNLCHLPEMLQYSEYLPPPKAFEDGYGESYHVAEFEFSPSPLTTRPTLKVVAISCSKILLEDGTQEVVKIAAIDILSCRILMNHFVCTNAMVNVADWRTAATGLTSYHEMEAARKDGYKVFRGWKAARGALWKFIDKETIIVGHNLRGDLDALRMVHARAVDVAKVIEKAANGPLSKQQLSLESLCCDLAKIYLKSHPNFGRDCLHNAFAARELVLWALKNEDQLKKWAKAKSLDYQRATL